jgi:hypothetical protein
MVIDPAAIKYDVAFSFTAADESIAQEISDGLAGQCRTFVYSEHQKELAGTDGQERFSRIFAQQSHLVVILYRSTWGTTKWTRIEQDAIKARYWDHGWDFTTFIAMEDKIDPPPWLPKQRLYYGLKRFGVRGAVPVIIARLQEQGITVGEESLEQRLARLQRQRDFGNKRIRFISSEIGVQAAKHAVRRLWDDLRQRVEGMDKRLEFSINPRVHLNETIVIGPPNLGMWVRWMPEYANTLEGSVLKVSIWRGYPPANGTFHHQDPTQLDSREYRFDLVAPDRECWTTSGRETSEINPQDLADQLLKWLADEVSRRIGSRH